MKLNGNMKLVDKNTLVGRDGLFSKRGCPGNCQHCSLWTEEGCRVILEAPTVDAVEVVYGQWQRVDFDGNVRCTACRKVSDEEYSYCPNCGAYMRGTRND